MWLRGVRSGERSVSERSIWPCGVSRLSPAMMTWVFVVAVADAPFSRCCWWQFLLLFCRTCFWAGETFSPKLSVCNFIPTQRFLHDTFMDVWEMLTCCAAVSDLGSVLGFEVRCLTFC